MKLRLDPARAALTLPAVVPALMLPAAFRSLKISPADEAKILGGNARKLFNL